MNPPIYIFAKSPIAGQVKTRLTSHCSAQQAAEIAIILLRNTVSLVQQAWEGDIYLSTESQPSHPEIQRILRDDKIQHHRQCSGDLGERMQQVFAIHQEGAAIIGADVVCHRAAYLQEAYWQLSQGKNIIAPTEDGGYGLIGLTQSAPNLFRNIAWGETSVFQSTICAAEKASIPLHSLAKITDIDYWQDVLEHVDSVKGLKAYLVQQRLL